MKTQIRNLTAASVSLLLLSACASTPTADESNTYSAEQQAQPTPSGLQGQAQGSNSAADPRALSSEQQALLQQTRLLFDFDQAGLRPDHQAVLNAHAKHLLANPNLKITLEGHADERGTREYNLALGERRAMSVEDALMIQGVSREQLRTTSLGEEDPVVYAQNERSYQQNRRVELKYHNDMQTQAN